MSSNELRITNAPVKHRLYDEAWRTLKTMGESVVMGQVIVLVGPTQAGKSLLMRRLTTFLKSLYVAERDGDVPVVDLQIETVEEGRVKNKWLCTELLKILGHPIYMHMGDLDEDRHYAPSRNRDEGSLRVAVKEALNSRRTRIVVLDEAHLLTRSKKSEFRGHILESIKSVAAIERTTIMTGGYELATKGLFDHPHFAGRVVVIDFGNYEDGPEGMREWKRILASFAKYLPLEKDDVLMKMAGTLLTLSNGTVGLLDKWLWTAWQQAKADGKLIGLSTLKKAAPSLREYQVIKSDITDGREALKSALDLPRMIGKGAEDRAEEPEQKKSNRNKPGRPFKRKAERLSTSKFDLFTA